MSGQVTGIEDQPSSQTDQSTQTDLPESSQTDLPESSGVCFPCFIL